MRISFADNVHGQLADSDHLVPIASKMTEAQHGLEILEAFQSDFGLSEEQAQRWWRHLMQTWLRDQADWFYDGKSGCKAAAFRLRFPDQALLFKHMKLAFEPEFVRCIAEKAGP